MRLSVAYNGDLELIDALARISCVDHIFGASSSSVTGTGRGSRDMPGAGKEDIREAVKRARDHGIAFNYLMNSSCMGNKEFGGEVRAQFIDEVKWAVSIGVEWLTLANPYLIAICKSAFPSLKISLSSFAMVESVERAVYFDGMGVDEISVRENIGRDLKLLREMQKSVRCDIQVIANQTCLYQCPLQFYHDNVMSHASQQDGGAEAQNLDYCIASCSYLKFADPANLIKARWIRPEDISIYESYGIDKFKITDRGKATKWIIRAAEAYGARRYDGNLADILNIIPTKDKRYIPAKAPVPRQNLFSTPRQKAFRYMEYLNVYIDNAALDGFLDKFVLQDCRGRDCRQCGHCAQTAERVISMNRELVDRGVKGLRQLLQQPADQI